MRTLVFYIPICACFGAFCAQVGAAEPIPSSHNLHQGYLRDGVLYVAAPPPKDAKDAYIRLWQANLRMKGVKEGLKVKKFRDWGLIGDNFTELRWRVATDGIWSHQGTFGGASDFLPWKDFQWLDTESGEKGEAALRKKYNIPPESNVISWSKTVCITYPVENIAWSLNINREDQLTARDFQVDFLPTTNGSYDLFVLLEEKITVIHVTKNLKAKKPEDEWKDKQGDVMIARFQEPFLAYGKPETPFFVTKSGKLYHVIRPNKEKPKVDLLWNEEKRPLTTILTDTNSGRSFALGVDQREGKNKQRFYLELTEKPEALVIDAKEWPTVKVAEPLAPMLQFARYLDAQKKLTGPKADK